MTLQAPDRPKSKVRRDVANRNSSAERPKWLLYAAIGALVVAVIVLLVFWRSGDKVGLVAPVGPQAWYTVDDGKTWFADAAFKPVPFDHQGKQAYRCVVWTCDGGKTKFVSHLERLTAAAQKQFAGKDKIQPWELFPGSQEVKPPLTGEKGWVSAGAPTAAQITTPRCPDGKSGKPTLVYAE